MRIRIASAGTGSGTRRLTGQIATILRRNHQLDWVASLVNQRESSMETGRSSANGPRWNLLTYGPKLFGPWFFSTKVRKVGHSSIGGCRTATQGQPIGQRRFPSKSL